LNDVPNTNLAQPQQFSLSLAHFPQVTFNCTRVQFPGMSGGAVSVPTPFQPIHLSGTSIEHDPLVLTILLNEDYSSYYTLIKWLKGRTISDSFEGYKKLEESESGIVSDGTIQLYTSANNPSARATFSDMFPLSVGGFTLDSQIEGVPQPITFQASFEYQTFSIS
jgi:hypothetical protein